VLHHKSQPNCDYSLKVIVAVGPVIGAGFHAAGLETCVRTARTQVVAAEFFAQLNVALNETPTAFDVGFRGE
jgi:hypothetical protein